MNESPGNAATEYSVSYSERVRDELRKLVARARARGLADKAIAAFEELERLLRIYPQFGQPLKDLNRPSASLWIGVVPPLVARYLLDEETRQVLVGYPIKTLRRSGLE
jgi:hypothetical protein